MRRSDGRRSGNVARLLAISLAIGCGSLVLETLHDDAKPAIAAAGNSGTCLLLTQ